jgi:hypothetical protein
LRIATALDLPFGRVAIKESTPDTTRGLLKTNELLNAGDILSHHKRDNVSRPVWNGPDKSLEKCLGAVRYTGSPASPQRMSSPWVLPALFVFLLMLLCGMAYLVRAGIRTRNLTECRRCGVSKVRPSNTQSSDALAGIFLLRPYRCGGCLTRFYAFRSIAWDHSTTPVVPVAVAVAANEPVPAPTRKSLFRTRVKVIVRLPWPTDWQSAWQLLLAEEQGFIRTPPDNRSPDLAE